MTADWSNEIRLRALFERVTFEQCSFQKYYFESEGSTVLPRGSGNICSANNVIVSQNY